MSCLRAIRSLAHPLVAALCLGAALTAATSSASAITREEVIVNAKAYTYHPWRCTTANLAAPCTSGYESLYVPGDYMGLPYDWGGSLSLFQFDQDIEDGLGAGSDIGDLNDCTTGVDCSGFVSRCWRSGHLTTDMIPDYSEPITQGEMLAGDVLDYPGVHVVLYSHELGNGEPVFYESSPPNVHVFMPGWSFGNNYDPYKYDNITGTSAGNPTGTTENPIAITLTGNSYTGSGDTTGSPSDVLDGCGLEPGTSEAGPEVIYELTLTQPGALTASVTGDEPGTTDIDVHIYTSHPHNTTIAHQVQC